MTTESDKIVCAKCGELITGESPSLDPGKRQPCPKCGSTSRSFIMHLEATIKVSDEVHDVLITYPQTLLSIAQSLIVNSQFSIAVVVSHMACEIATERSLSESFIRRGVQYLEDPITEFLNSYSLSNDRIRKLYTALTGDHIEKQRFWQKFKESAKRRNQIVHQGLTVGKTEAEESFKAASDFVAHLNK